MKSFILLFYAHNFYLYTKTPSSQEAQRSQILSSLDIHDKGIPIHARG